MKYLDKKFTSPANSRAYVDNWDAVFGDGDLRPTCLRCYEAGLDGNACPGGDSPRDCKAPRPWQCFCHAYMKGECACGAWDDA